MRNSLLSSPPPVPRRIAMRHRVLSLLVAAFSVAFTWSFGSAGSLAGQDAQIATRGPRFFSAASPTPVPLDVRRVAILRRQVSLDLTGATLEQALAEITRQTRLQFMYSKNVLPINSPVQF